MITIKSGVPGSGKTQSMVADLMAMLAVMKKTGEYRPIYTNITGLKQDVIPHHFMTDPKAWMDCPAGAIIVIDEAQENGYEALSNSKVPPEYVKKLAVHRKDFSVDMWFITQNPKLLHTYCRAQCGKHQHYERKFGLKRAFCFEWHECHDNLQGKKTAVVSQFAFASRYQNAYHSADVHTKQKFKIPVWIAIPLIAIPLGIFSLPKAYSALSGAMTGKGVTQEKDIANEVKKASGAKAPPSAPLATAPYPVPAASAPLLPTSGAPIGNYPATPVLAGCIATPKRCGCFDTRGTPIEMNLATCQDRAAVSDAPGAKADTSAIGQTHQPTTTPQDLEVLAYMAKSRQR